jgi:DNA helicase-2/ATP-dependent DNA helicase PcrA
MSKLLENLNKEQTQAVTQTEGPLLIVAGAGTGKTTVITRKIAYLIEQKLAKPEEILALTFTEKAAGEMQERVDLLLPMGYYDSWISTFHSFGERILKTHALDIGLPNDFKLLDDSAQWMLIYNNFEKFNLDYYRPLGNPNKFIDSLLSHFSKCKDELITPKQYLEYAQGLRLNNDQSEKGLGKRGKKKNILLNPNPLTLNPLENETEIARLEEVANAFHVYQKLLLDKSALDFGDLINYCLELFLKRPKILKLYQEKFKYILVDEFQDTNFAQYQLIKLLSGDKKNLAVVGDDDQSIYKFRGASVSNILKFKDDFPQFKQITLTENYRSGKEILDLAYNFIQKNNPDRLEVKLNINKKLKANIKTPAKIAVIEAKDLNEELAEVAKKIIELKNFSSHSEGRKKGEVVSWNDFAILIRSNSASEELLPVLSNFSIPHTFFASFGLYKKPIVLDLICYAQVLDNFHNSFALYRVLNLPIFKLGGLDLSKLLENSNKKTLSLFEILENSETFNISPEGQKNLALALKMLKQHQILATTKTATEAIVEIIKDLEFSKRLNEETLENSENRELVEQFYKQIEKFEAEETDKSLHNFLHILDLKQQAGDTGKINFDPNQGPESVKVMTAHSSKGLEFENVFIINLVDQKFPSRSKGDGIEIPKELVKDILPEGDFHLQEERRLFYVAVTRAKTNLFLTWAKDYGGKTLKKPSLFLQETELVPSEKINQATGKVIFENKFKTNKKQVFHILPERFSYSQITNFLNCPLEYKYKNYLKLPLPGTHHLSFGVTIHKVFEEYLKYFQNLNKFDQQDLFGKSKQSPVLPKYEMLEEYYKKYWVDEWYTNKTEKEKYKKRGREMLLTFYKECETYIPKPLFVEKSFFIPLGKYKFTGKIDRADQEQNGVVIYDYKTGKKPKKTDKKDIDQLYIYQWAMEEYFQKKVVGLKYWYLQEQGFAEEELASPEKIEKLKQELLETMEKIVHTTKYDLFKELDLKKQGHECKFRHLE